MAYQSILILNWNNMEKLSKEEYDIINDILDDEVESIQQCDKHYPLMDLDESQRLNKVRQLNEIRSKIDQLYFD